MRCGQRPPTGLTSYEEFLLGTASGLTSYEELQLSACPPGGGSLASEPVDTVTGDGVGVCLAFGAGLFHSVRPCNACWARYREDSAVRQGRTELAFFEAQLGPRAPECTSLGEGLPPVDVRLRACKAGASQPALPVAQRLEFFQTDAVASGAVRDSSSEVHKAALDSGANVRISGKESGFAWLARLPRPVRVYLGDDETCPRGDPLLAVCAGGA